MKKLTEEEIKDLLNEEQLEYFNTLAASYKRNYIIHITSAKQEATMLKRIEEVQGALELKCKNIFDYKKKINPRKETSDDMNDIEKIESYFNKVENEQGREVVKKLFFQILKDFKELKERYAWNQPMITINDSFVMALSTAKNHFSISFEGDTLNLFSEQFEKSGYKMLKKGFQIQYTQDIDYEQLKEAIKYTITYKKDCPTFWKE